ncbi:unnamed protein product [Gadus morhua 'NCC']
MVFLVDEKGRRRGRLSQEAVSPDEEAIEPGASRNRIPVTDPGARGPRCAETASHLGSPAVRTARGFGLDALGELPAAARSTKGGGVCATWPLGLLVLFHWVKSMRWTPEGKAKLEFGDINLGLHGIRPRSGPAHSDPYVPLRFSPTPLPPAPW